MRNYLSGLKNDVPVIRCVFGVSLGLIISTSLGYLIPQITAIFALTFLIGGKEPLSLKKGILTLAGLTLICYSGWILGKTLFDFPLVFLIVLGVLVYKSFRSTHIALPIRVMFLLMVILISFATLKAEVVGIAVFSALILNLFVALIVVSIAFLVFPWTEKESKNTIKEQSIVQKNLNPDKLAFNGFLVVFPVVIIYFILYLDIAFLTLAFIVVLSFDPFIYQSKKGPAFLLANLIGGSVGILAYYLLVITPDYTIYIFLLTLIGFFFAINIFSGKSYSPLFKIGYNTFFVVMGVVSTSNEGAGNTIIERLLQIAIAVVYVIVAFKIVNTFNDPVINEKK